MGELDNLFGKPKFIDGIGDIHPIKMSQWSEFSLFSQVISLRREQFYDAPKDMKLLDCLFAEIAKNDRRILPSLIWMFANTLKTENITHGFNEDKQEFVFVVGAEGEINRDNYDIFRATVMEQNLLLEPKVYPNKITQEWAEKALAFKAKSNKGITMTMEDKITTLASYERKDPEIYLDYTIYKFEAMFQRMCHMKDFDSQSILLANPYAAEAVSKSLGHYAQSINLRKSPYDEVFEKESKNSLTNSLK